MLGCVVLAGCGRLGFGTADHGGPDDAATDSDAPGPELVRFAMDDDPTATSRVTGAPASRTVSCDTCPRAVADHVVGTGAYAFDGGQRVVLGQDLIPVATAYTITLWFKPATNLGFGSAISKPIDTSTVFNEISLAIADNLSYEGYDGTAIIDVKAPLDTRDDAWHFIALVYDGANRMIFLDGATAPAVTRAGPFVQSTLPLAIGADLDNGAFAVPYSGLLDDLRIYPHALLPTELTAVFAER